MMPAIKTITKLLVGLFALIGFILSAGFFGAKLGWTNSLGIVDPGSNKFNNLANVSRGAVKTNPDWAKTEEWQVIREALIRDSGLIKHVSEQANIEPRLIAAMIVPEQLRLFNTEREVFKSYFAPLRILGNQTQFSWGIAGFKQETAAEVERRAGLKVSAEERFRRLTSDDDHYYSYYYTALYLKQIMAEWQKAGFDISARPEILATLFNIGFDNSRPKADPQVGGAEITIGRQTSSFGGLAYDFYYSGELADIFPPRLK